MSDGVELEYSKRFSNKQIRMLMIILFIVTLAVLHIALIFLFIITENAPSVLVFDYTWIFWCFIPIPLLSIILGYHFKKKGLKCKKNIIAGIIMTTLLFIFGLSWLGDPNDLTDYQEFYQYNKYLGVTLPSEATYVKSKYTLEGIVLIHHNLFFSNYEEIDKMLNEIKENSNWKLKEDLSTNISFLIPFRNSCSGSNSCYYSVYIEELDKYNVYPIEAGDYHIVVMNFNKNDLVLTLDEYLLNYKE